MRYIKVKGSSKWHELKEYSLATICGRIFTTNRIASLRHAPGGRLCSGCLKAREKAREEVNSHDA